MPVMFRKKKVMVAGVQWNGYNLMEIKMFLDLDTKIPRTKEEWEGFIEMQDRYRREGLVIKHFAHDMIIHLNDWVVQYEDGGHGISTKAEIRKNYDLLESGF